MITNSLTVDRYVPPHRRDSGRNESDQRGGGGGYPPRSHDIRYEDRRGSYDDRRGSYDDRRGSRDHYSDRRGSDYGRQQYDRRDNRHGNYDDRRGSGYQGYDDRPPHKGSNNVPESTKETEEVDGVAVETGGPPREGDQRNPPGRSQSSDDRWAQLDQDRRFSTPSESDRRGGGGYDRRGSYPNFGHGSYQRSQSDWGGSSYGGRGHVDWGVPLPRNDRLER